MCWAGASQPASQPGGSPRPNSGGSPRPNLASQPGVPTQGVLGVGGSASQPGAEIIPKPACRFMCFHGFEGGSMKSGFWYGDLIVGSKLSIWGSVCGGVCSCTAVCADCAGVAHECGGCNCGPGGSVWAMWTNVWTNVGSMWSWCGLVSFVLRQMGAIGSGLLWVPFLSGSIGRNPSKPDHTPMCASQLRVPPILGVPDPASQLRGGIWRPSGRPSLVSQPARPSWGGPWRVPFGVFIKVLARVRPSGRPSLGGSPRPNLASQPGVPIWRPSCASQLGGYWG